MIRGLAALAILVAMAVAIHHVPGDVVLVVDGQRMTRAEFDAEQGKQPAALACARESLREANVPAEQLATSKTFISLVEATPIDVVETSYAVMSLALQAAANRRHITVTDDEVSASVRVTREFTERLLQQPDSAQPCGLRIFKQQIDEVGADEFWNEVIPASSRRGLITTKLMQAENVSPTKLAAYQADRGLHAHVQAGPALPPSVSPEAIHTFLEAFERISGGLSN